MYTYCQILWWDSFKTVTLCLLHIMYILILFVLCVNLKKKKRIKKNSLSCFDDKMYLLNNGYDPLGLGY